MVLSRGLALLAATVLLGCGDGDAGGSGGAGSTTSGQGPSGTTSGAGGGSTSSAGATSTAAAGGGASSSASSSGATSSGSSSGSSTGSSSSSGRGGAAGCLPPLTAGHHEVGCEGGVTYEVEIPAACVGGGCGLVVDMHGYTMNADAEDENTGMRALGQARGYVVVQPTAPVDGFGFPSWDQPTHAPLVHRFVDDLAAALGVDLARVHAMGFSQGGGMTFRLLCDHADLFASGAPIGALEGCSFTGGSPSEEVDVLHVHGRRDSVVSFDAVAIPQRDAALAAWPFGAPTILEEDELHRATRWVTPSGTTFEFWEHDYETSAEVLFVGLDGHCVPGGQDFDGLPAGYSCEDEGTFVFGELAMAFFEAHPKD